VNTELKWVKLEIARATLHSRAYFKPPTQIRKPVGPAVPLARGPWSILCAEREVQASDVTVGGRIAGMKCT